MGKQNIRTKPLGREGLAVPAIGIGTWAWGDTLFWGYGDRYGEAEVEAAFDAAIAAGLTFFDTAEVYGMGESERLLGRFMHHAQHPVQIATKYGALPWRFTQASVFAAVSASLERLQTDYIPLYQVHWPFHWFLGVESLFTALAQEVKDGRIQAVGVSNYSAAQMTQAHRILADHGIPLAVNQVRYSLITRKIERNGILDTARQLGVTILAYSPLAQGLLTGKYTADHQPSGARKLDSRFSKRGLEKNCPSHHIARPIGRTSQSDNGPGCSQLVG